MRTVVEMAGADKDHAADDEEVPMDAAEFAFDLPEGVEKGTVLQVKAPDGVLLKIPTPGNVCAGDRMHMEKSASTGKWGIKHVVRCEVAPEPPAPLMVEKSGELPRRADEELAADLIEGNVQIVKFETSKGPLKIRVVPSWAPRGAQRFLQLVTNKYYADLAVYRAVPGFLVQFGVVNDVARTSQYEAIPDDLLRGVPIVDGTVCFAAAGANTRTATICIFLGEFPQLGVNQWETPIGKVCEESMGVLHSIFTGYGDMPQCGGAGPDPIQLEELGNDYITENFPACDFVKSAEWLSP